MESQASLIEAFDTLNERKRKDPDCLTKTEKARWRMMRCEIEEALFQIPRDPAKDTREFLRVPISMKVAYSVSGQLQERYLTILGEGGLFVATDDTQPLGTRLNFQGYPVSGGLPFKARGEVVWVQKTGDPAEHGMGIKFIQLSDQQLLLIYTLVDDTVRQGLLERRSYSRIDTRLAVSLESGSKKVEAQTHDLCLAGMFVASDFDIRHRDKIDFRLRIPGGQPLEKGRARVIHGSEKTSQSSRGGFGVAFIDLGVEGQALIRGYMSGRVTGKIRHKADEPRRHARLMRRIKLRFQAVNSFGTTDARDISGGGVFVQNRMPPPQGSKIDVNLVDPATLQTLDLSGTVVRVVKPSPEYPQVVFIVMQTSQSTPGIPVEGMVCSGVVKSPCSGLK